MRNRCRANGDMLFKSNRVKKSIVLNWRSSAGGPQIFAPRVRYARSNFGICNASAASWPNEQSNASNVGGMRSWDNAGLPLEEMGQKTCRKSSAQGKSSSFSTCVRRMSGKRNTFRKGKRDYRHCPDTAQQTPEGVTLSFVWASPAKANH